MLPVFNLWASRPRAGNKDKKRPSASFPSIEEHREEFLLHTASGVCLDEMALAKLKPAPLLHLLETQRPKLGLGVMVTTQAPCEGTEKTGFDYLERCMSVY